MRLGKHGMRNPAVIVQAGWMRRAMARGAAIGVALVAHGAALSALTYSPTDKRVLDQPSAAIFVEIVAVPPRGSGQNAASETTSSTLPEPDRQTPAERRPPESTERETAAKTDSPVPLPRPQPVTAAKAEPSKARPVRRVALSRVPETEAPSVTDAGVPDALEGGAAGEAGTAILPADIPSAWKSRLLSHLDRYKRYPQAARAKKAEGTALLSFGMDRDGRVLGYYLVRSSGCPELDDEVFAMLARAAPLPPAPPEIRAQVVQLVVPVRFRM